MAVLCTATAGLTASAGEPPKGDALSKKVRILLATRCLECHSGAKPSGGLDLSRLKSLRKGGESGAAVVPKSPAKSLLWKRVQAGEMPPKHPLAKAERELFRRWILAGATWQGGPIDRFRFTTNKRAGYDWWALQPLRDVRPPIVKQTTWPRNAIDRFILKRLERAGLKPSPEANPRALIRRLYVDLIGLPPTPTEVDAFVANPSEKNYSAIVDRLLKSPRYGERWGRHWLDVVRFGESDGFERNNPRKNFWPYRDWVIRAFNDDMPYDRFVRMQLAGDVLKPGRDGSAAVGFLVAGVHNTVVGGSKRMKLLARQDELEEVVAAVGQTFLGLTINCARCHDHKFDPIRTTEYYQMIAALDGVRHGERNVRSGDIAKNLADARNRLARIDKELAAFDNTIRKRILAKRKKSGKRPKNPDVPKPFAKWEFDGDLKDSLGRLHGKAVNGARLQAGALVLDGKRAYVQTAPLKKSIGEKTLEAWVLLDNLSQRGGAAISLETIGGVVFDAIVFGEREPQRWMAGSNSFRRTKSFRGPAESSANNTPTHIAIVYRKDGTVTAYRNGIVYGTPYKTGFQTFPAGKSNVVFGLRHSPVGGNKMLKGRILRAALYDRALSPKAIAAAAGVEQQFVSEKAILASLTKTERAIRKQRITTRDLLTAQLKRIEAIASPKMYTVVPRQPGLMRVHVRGSVTDYGPEVVPAGVKAVTG